MTAALSQYGALIWASDLEQAKHESIVVVPEYPSVIIDDHGSHTTTDDVEMTTRLLSSVQSTCSVDPERVYGTGQSMGCMTVMYLAAQHPDLFAAGDSINFATFATGTVLEVAGTGGGGGGASEHMASFEPAYKITALRDWLFQQSA